MTLESTEADQSNGIQNTGIYKNTGKRPRKFDDLFPSFWSVSVVYRIAEMSPLPGLYDGPETTDEVALPPAKLSAPPMDEMSEQEPPALPRL